MLSFGISRQLFVNGCKQTRGSTHQGSSRPHLTHGDFHTDDHIHDFRLIQVLFVRQHCQHSPSCSYRIRHQVTNNRAVLTKKHCLFTKMLLQHGLEPVLFPPYPQRQRMCQSTMSSPSTNSRIRIHTFIAQQSIGKGHNLETGVPCSIVMKKRPLYQWFFLSHFLKLGDMITTRSPAVPSICQARFIQQE